MTTLAGRTALVTGGGNGLGRAIAIALAAAGADVVLVGRTPATLEASALLVRATGRSARVERCDVSDPGEVADLARRTSGVHVSILVNNAGIGGPVKSLVDVEPSEWDEVFAVNVRSAYLMSRAYLPAMVAAGAGDVVMIASVSGKRPLVRRTPYTASKMALIGLTRTLAFEVGAAGVAVNSVSPGPVRGDRMARNFRLEAEATGTSAADAELAFVSRAATGRLLEEYEVGDAVVGLLRMTGLCGADIDLSAGMIAP
ncbi:SDR family NAD(P)-dependent oxidoreductase [Jatrophihabitans sp. YIM 134969]